MSDASPTEIDLDKRSRTRTESSWQEPKLWRNLRFRFGLLLGLALLPWLAFTVIEVLTNLNRTRLSQVRTLDLVAETAVREVGLVLEAGMLGIEAAPRLIDREGCEATGESILKGLRVYTDFVVQNQDGDIICQSRTGITRAELALSADFTPQRRFRLEPLMLPNDETMQLALQKRDAEMNRTYSLILPASLGLETVLQATIGEGSVLNIAKPGGEPIVGDVITRAEQDILQPNLTTRDTVFVNWEDENGQLRRISASYIEPLDIYVGVVRDRAGDGIRALINPYTNVLLPILAWAVGFGLIWLGTQSMIIKPLRKIRIATRQFSMGRLKTPISLSGSAAEEVHGLARSFNRMVRDLDDREAKLADNIEEKDVLMREIHHRVKNNLQIIISLLNMQERKATHEETLNALSETRARINAIAAVHYGLYESPDLRGVNIESFVSRLISSLSDSLDIEEQGVVIEQSLQACELPADSAIPVALFLVEAITNSVNHGVSRGGQIRVEIKEADNEALRIAISDNGKGFGDPKQMKGIGTRLMRGFARQLGAELKFRDNNPGLEASLNIPKANLSETTFRMSRKRA